MFGWSNLVGPDLALAVLYRRPQVKRPTAATRPDLTGSDQYNRTHSLLRFAVDFFWTAHLVMSRCCGFVVQQQVDQVEFEHNTAINGHKNLMHCEDGVHPRQSVLQRYLEVSYREKVQDRKSGHYHSYYYQDIITITTCFVWSDTIIHRI